MYRNSSDRRVKHSADQLFDAIVRLLKSKKFDEIKISEVASEAGIGRATFYRNFDYVVDVLLLKLDALFLDLTEYMENNRSSTPVELLTFFNYWCEHAEFLQVLNDAEQWQLFNQRFTEKSDIRLVEISDEAGFTELEFLYLRNSVNALVDSTLHTWLRNGCKESPMELMKMFSTPFRLYQQRLIAEDNQMMKALWGDA